MGLRLLFAEWTDSRKSHQMTDKTDANWMNEIQLRNAHLELENAKLEQQLKDMVFYQWKMQQELQARQDSHSQSDVHGQHNKLMRNKMQNQELRMQMQMLMTQATQAMPYQAINTMDGVDAVNMMTGSPISRNERASDRPGAAGRGAGLGMEPTKGPVQVTEPPRAAGAPDGAAFAVPDDLAKEMALMKSLQVSGAPNMRMRTDAGHFPRDGRAPAPPVVAFDVKRGTPIPKQEVQFQPPALHIGRAPPNSAKPSGGAPAEHSVPVKPSLSPSASPVVGDRGSVLAQRAVLCGPVESLSAAQGWAYPQDPPVYAQQLLPQKKSLQEVRAQGQPQPRRTFDPNPCEPIEPEDFAGMAHGGRELHAEHDFPKPLRWTPSAGHLGIEEQLAQLDALAASLGHVPKPKEKRGFTPVPGSKSFEKASYVKQEQISHSRSLPSSLVRQPLFAYEVANKINPNLVLDGPWTPEKIFPKDEMGIASSSAAPASIWDGHKNQKHGTPGEGSGIQVLNLPQRASMALASGRGFGPPEPYSSQLPPSFQDDADAESSDAKSDERQQRHCVAPAGGGVTPTAWEAVAENLEKPSAPPIRSSFPEAGNAKDSSDGSPGQGAHAKQYVGVATPCEHKDPGSWKRLRLKKGMQHFLCLECGTKWKAPSLTASVNKQHPASPEAAVLKLKANPAMGHGMPSGVERRNPAVRHEMPAPRAKELTKESELTTQQLQQLQEDVALEDMHDLPTAQETSSRRAGGPPGRLLMFNGSPPLAKATPPQMLLEEVSLLEGNLKLLGELESHASALKHVLFDEPSTKPGSPRLADSQFLIPQSFTDPLQRTGAKSEVAEDGRRSHSFFNDLEGRVNVMDMDMGDLGSLLDPAC